MKQAIKHAHTKPQCVAGKVSKAAQNNKVAKSCMAYLLQYDNKFNLYLALNESHLCSENQYSLAH